SLSLLFLAIRPPPLFTLFPYTTLFRSPPVGIRRRPPGSWSSETTVDGYDALPWTPSFVSLMRNSRGRNRTRRTLGRPVDRFDRSDRKSTRLNSSHVKISYAVFCLKKKK